MLLGYHKVHYYDVYQDILMDVTLIWYSFFTIHWHCPQIHWW